jgi:hypothetical protein
MSHSSRRVFSGSSGEARRPATGFLTPSPRPITESMILPGIGGAIGVLLANAGLWDAARI